MEVDGYFNGCNLYEADGTPINAPSIAGLCLRLGINKDTFYYYSDGRYEERLALAAREQKQELIETISEEKIIDSAAENGVIDQFLLPYQGMDEIDTMKKGVSDCLKRAKSRLEEWTWNQGYRMKNPAMAIFSLKAVHRYSDQPAESTLNATQLNLNIKIVNNEQKRPVIEVSKD
jgi:hypothetical protein